MNELVLARDEGTVFDGAAVLPDDVVDAGEAPGWSGSCQ